MAEAVDVLLMTPPSGSSAAERWVADGRLAATRDLLARLRGSGWLGRVFVLAADERDRAVLAGEGAIPWLSHMTTFHFGRALADFVIDQAIERLAYFGGASAPLLDPLRLQQAVEQLSQSDSPLAWVNNYYSTDWALFHPAGRVVEVADKLGTDNPLGWVLAHDAGFRVRSFPPSAATRADIDTSSDLLLLEGHPDLGPHLSDFLARAPADLLGRVKRLRAVLLTPASTLTIIGRSSSHVWQLLEQRTEIWVRLVVEERGMIASGRVARGEVRSLAGAMLDDWGPRRFVETLVSMSDAVLWDTRVWMASRGSWPSDADRFAADLGWADQVAEPRLRALTQAIVEAPIPIVTGGHGVVAGSIYGLVEALSSGAPGLPVHEEGSAGTHARGAAHQPAR